MPETDNIFADPNRILALAEDLLKFTITLHKDAGEIETAHNNLGRTWRDADFEKFRHLCKRLKESLAEVAEDVRHREPELREDAETLIRYHNLQLS